MRRRYLASLALLCVAFAAPPARAQVVVGRVLDADGGTPLGGAFLTLQDSSGRRRAGVLSDDAGRFLLTAPGAGRYVLVAERLGMATTRTTPFALAVDERRPVTVALKADAVPLAAIEVSGKRRCQVHPSVGEATARVWEEVRKALRVSAWAGGTQALDVTLRRHERVFALPGRAVLSDSVMESTGTTTRTYVTPLSPERLAREGYVVREADGGYSYSGPDDEILASDEFLDSHCLQLRPRSAGDSVLALDFKRVHARGPVDIEGTVWLNARAGELRAIDFRFAGLEFHTDEAGGRVEYRRLPNGAWIVERWTLTFPLLKRVFRAPMALGRQATHATDDLVAYGLHESTGEIVHMRIVGAATDATSPRQASGSVAGTVYDSLHSAPLAGARVYLSGTGYGATTDESGRFRIAGVPPGRYRLAFSHAVLEQVPVLPGPRDVVVAQGREAEAAAFVPSRAAMRLAACPARLAPDAAVVFGAVAGAGAGVLVRAIWQHVTRGASLVIRTEALEAETDAGGRYILCGVGGGGAVTVRAVTRELDGSRRYGPEVRVAPGPGEVARADPAMR